MGNKPSPPPKCKGNGPLGFTCQTVLKAPITAGNDAACAPVGALFALGCDLALGGPEDVAGDVVCGAATAGAELACGKGVEAAEEALAKGTSFNPSDIAKKVCAKQFCNT